MNMNNGQLKKMLNEMQDHVPVVLNVCREGDGRKRHSPWVEDFRVCVTTYRGKNVIMLHGYQPLSDKE